MRVTTISASETAYLLRQALGPVRSWGDWLADLLRDRAAPHFGLRLLPVAGLKSRCRRPVYATADVAKFIRSALALCPVGAVDRSVVKILIDIPTGDMAAPWQFRRAQIARVAP
jgi:hypothetical protein